MIDSAHTPPAIMRIDVPRTGRPRLGVVEIRKDGSYREA